MHPLSMKGDHSVVSFVPKKTLTIAILFFFLTKSHSQNYARVEASVLHQHPTHGQNFYDTSNDTSQSVNKRVQKIGL
jgi:hypothetical protein